MFAGQTVTCLTDKPVKLSKKGQANDGAVQLPTPVQKQVKVAEDGSLKVTLQPMGGIVIR